MHPGDLVVERTSIFYLSLLVCLSQCSEPYVALIRHSHRCLIVTYSIRSRQYSTSLSTLCLELPNSDFLVEAS